jgi:hypothetical protein
MKCAAVIVLASIAFVSQALAVLRPLFPAKTSPPFNSEVIVIGNNAIQHPAKQRCGTAPRYTTGSSKRQAIYSHYENISHLHALNDLGDGNRRGGNGAGGSRET